MRFMVMVVLKVIQTGKMKPKEIYQYALGTLVVMGFFFILWIMFTKVLPTENKEIGLLVIGALVLNEILGWKEQK